MPSFLVCYGTLSPAVAGTAAMTLPVPNVLACSTGWTVVEYVPDTPDLSSLITNVAALNEFDPVQVASIVTFCFVVFIVGFGCGVVIRQMRRS